MCREFARKGTCSFKNCKFRHDVEQRQRTIHSNSKTSRKDTELSDSEKRFRRWRQNIPLDYIPIKPLRGNLSWFFQEARTLVETEVNVLQKVIQNLSSEGGLRCICELVEQDFEGMSTSTKDVVFQSDVFPFLDTLSHPTVVSSLILEQPVGTIYKVVYGINGRRASRFLQYISGVLARSMGSKLDVVKQLEVSLLVFSQMVDMNSAAFI